MISPDSGDDVSDERTQKMAAIAHSKDVFERSMQPVHARENFVSALIKADIDHGRNTPYHFAPTCRIVSCRPRMNRSHSKIIFLPLHRKGKTCLKSSPDYASRLV